MRTVSPSWMPAALRSSSKNTISLLRISGRTGSLFGFQVRVAQHLLDARSLYYKLAVLVLLYRIRQVAVTGVLNLGKSSRRSPDPGLQT